MKDKTHFDTSRLVPFIMVVAWMLPNYGQASPATDQVSLEWDPPTQRMDGSVLTDIIGYHVYVGTASGAYDQDIQTTTENSISITDLISLLEPEEGETYYFVVTARDESGHESPFSEEFSWRWFSTPHTVNFSTPHWWLAEFGITNAQEDVVEMDLDGDGVPVWQEYIMDSDPTDSTCHLTVLITPYHENENPAGRVIGSRLEWEASTQRVYRVESSADLQTWSPVPELAYIESSSESIVATPLFGNADPLMYRVQVQLP